MRLEREKNAGVGTRGLRGSSSSMESTPRKKQIGEKRCGKTTSEAWKSGDTQRKKRRGVELLAWARAVKAPVQHIGRTRPRHCASVRLCHGCPRRACEGISAACLAVVCVGAGSEGGRDRGARRSASVDVATTQSSVVVGQRLACFALSPAGASPCLRLCTTASCLLAD